MNRYLLLLTLLGGVVDCRLACAQAAPSPFTCFAWNQFNPAARAEGTAELVSDVLIIL